MTSGSNLSEAFVKQFERKKVRDTFVAEMVSSRLAKMIRSLREQNGWSQKELAKMLGTTQSAVSRIENAEYGKVSVATLLSVAAAFDLPLFIDMPEWRDWFLRMRDMSKASFARQGFNVAAITKVAGGAVKVSKASASAVPPKHYHSASAIIEREVSASANAGFYVIHAQSEGKAA